MQNSLLSQDRFRLVRVSAIDARVRSDDYIALRDHILQNEQSYPGISRWFDSKVSNGLRSGQRTGFVGLLNERPVAAAILKRGSASKFCHLKIDESVRSLSLGDLFFTLMTLELRDHAETVRFTLPESVWDSRKAFFESFAFTHAEKAGRQYRLCDIELYSKTEFAQLFSASQLKIPKLFGHLAIGNHSLLTGAVLAVQPGALEKIVSGEKTVEIRTRFSKRWEGCRVSLYRTRPASGLAGEATIARVIEGSPDRIWEHFGHCAGCTRSEFDAYVRDKDSISALVLCEVQSFDDPVPLAQLNHLLGLNLVAPQSYLSLQNNDGWLTAVVLAAALQGSIRFSRERQAASEIRTPKRLSKIGFP